MGAPTQRTLFLAALYRPVPVVMRFALIGARAFEASAATTKTLVHLAQRPNGAGQRLGARRETAAPESERSRPQLAEFLRAKLVGELAAVDPAAAGGFDAVDDADEKKAGG